MARGYSAITMERSYKAPRSHEKALEIMRSVAGTQLDSDLVEIFCKIPKSRIIACQPEQIKFDITDTHETENTENKPAEV